MMSINRNKIGRVFAKIESGSTVQKHFANEVNINTIVGKYMKNGITPVMAMNKQYGDFSEGVDYHEAMNRVTRVREEFEKLPGEVKKRFRQDPGSLIDFVSDEKNRDEAIKMGLIEKPKQPKLNEMNKVDKESEQSTEGKT